MAERAKNGGWGSPTTVYPALAWSRAQADARARAASGDLLTLLAGALGVADAVIVLALSLLAFVLRHGIQPIPLEILATSAFACLLTANAMSISGAYSTLIKSGFNAQVGNAAKNWTIVFSLMLTAGYLTKTLTDYSRFWAALWYLSVMLGLALVRLAATAQLRRWRARGKLASTVAIVDLAGSGAEFARRIQRDETGDVRLLGVFTADDAARPHGGVTDLIALSRLFRIDEIFVLTVSSAPGTASDDLTQILRRLGTLPTNVRICPLLPRLGYTAVRDTTVLYDMPMLTVHRRPLGGWSSVAKRLEDLVIGTLGLILVAPVMAIIAICIKLDSRGPVLFRQARQGFNNNIITVLKFRTMVHQPEASRDVVVQATRDDRRVTRVGRFLRRTSLDELPQLFNVLRGEMSLVGPRPHAVVHNQQYAELIDDYAGRHRMQPGITGWAQVNGLRGETDTIEKMQKRVDYDLSYINDWSITLDLKIIFRTAVSVLFDRQAY